ncbi:MAG: hypothetical protein IJJ74_02165 [Eubacterium sp.]|nr:hypothetical protein [Eubacterium sp.]
MKKKGIASRVVAGCLAMMMTIGSGILPSPGKAKEVSAASIQPVKINSTNFPDANFRSVISGRDYDRDGNGTLDAKEIGLTLNIYCEGMNISSLKGVEYFVDLQGLWCKDNNISSLDVTKNKDLRGLWCSNNPLTKLDLSQNKELVWVYCYDCNLSALDITHNPKMAYVECSDNPIKTLDLSKCPELEHLICGSCELSKLDVSKNPKLQHLDAFRNKFKTLDVSKNTKMKRLDVWDNPGLGSIDVTHNPGLQYYNCANNDAASIDVSKNPELNKLICSYNDIKKLDVTHNPKLVILNCEDNQISSLDLTKNPQLRYLQAAINGFTSLNIGNNPFLVKTYKEGKFTQEWYGRSWTINYGGDVSTSEDNSFYMWLNDNVTLSTQSSGTINTGYIKYSDLADGVSEKDLLTRETVVQTLYELAGKPSVSGLTSRFKDVKSGAWYTNALLWGQKNSICMGYPNVSSDNFGVGEWITRQDLVFMLMRYSEYKKYKRSIDFGRSDEYIDYYDIDYDHWEAICWSATWNIMEGKGKAGAPKSEQRIDPYGRVTRNEFITIMKRLFAENGISTSTNIPISNKAVPITYNTTPTWSWNGNSTATAKLTSTSDKNHAIYIVASVTTKVNTAPTLTKSGTSTVTASVNVGGKKSTETKKITTYAFNPSYTGVAKFGNDWWYVKKGQVQYVNSVEKNDNGWWIIQNGKVNFGYTGFAKNSNGWWYIRNGKVDFSKKDVIKGTVNGQTAWWFVSGGKVQFVDSVEQNSNGWWVIRKGKVNFNYNGFAKNQYGWWYCRGGKVDFSKNDVMKGTVNGQNGWWFVKGGKVQFVNSVEKNSNGWWVIQNGKVNFSFNGLAKNSNGWWVIQGGKVNFSFTGIAKNEYGQWYCKGGKVQFDYNGSVYYNGRYYNIKGGKVVN